MTFHPDNRFFLLPLQFEVDRLLQDLQLCEAEQWSAHYNQKDYTGEWSGIALRSQSGKSKDLVAVSSDSFVDTPLLSECHYFREIVSHFECPIEVVRLLALSPGSLIKTHRDPGLGYAFGRFRLHIPILTDPGVDFTVDSVNLLMEAGQCWYADFSLPHSVAHQGQQRRIHLVIDGVRNAWTDQLFARAGYRFEQETQEEVLDPRTKNEMIYHLQKMDTAQARTIMAALSSPEINPLTDSPGVTPESPVDLTKGWMPASVSGTGSQVAFSWQYVGAGSFSEPFFQQTLRQSRHHPLNLKHSGIITSSETLHEVARGIDTIPPTAIIFHVSRCGSTLLSQLLSLDDRCVVVSEPPILDTLLRWPYQDHAEVTEIPDDAFQDVIRILGRRKDPKEQYFFIKTDSWHIFLVDYWRRLFPTTPFLFLYRHPAEVIQSQIRQPGLQSIPYYLESGLTEIPFQPEWFSNKEVYLQQLLIRLYSCLVRIQKQDPLSWFVNFNDGVPVLLTLFEKATGIEFSADMRIRMDERLRYHAKKPYELFSPEIEFAEHVDVAQELLDIYHTLEKGI